jgi:secondary thiamine-phosphate synthase enzyme
MNMNVTRHEVQLATHGHGHTIDLTDEITGWLRAMAATDGQLTVFVPGSTAGVTTIEYEPGALRDLEEALERFAPSDGAYHHNILQGDRNGFSHLRAALLGPSLVVPVAGGRCVLGTWQQVVVVECDLGPRRRRVVLSYLGLCAAEN